MFIGIDIGADTARAAYLDRQQQPRLISFRDGSTAMPALAHQTLQGLVIGAEAEQALVGNAETSIVGCTRLMGRAGNIPPALLERLPYLVREAGGEAICNLLFAEVAASTVYGKIARSLADAAQAHLSEPIDGVVLSVPAGAEDRFRIQARHAVEAEGLRVLQLINQPTAAALALGQAAGQLIAIVSCGGGTTEVSIAERSPHGIRVRAVASDPLLGGDDMAWAVAERLNTYFQHTAGIDVFQVGDSRVAAQGLRAAAAEILTTLAAQEQAWLVLEHGGGFGHDLTALVRRQDVERWLDPLLARIGDLCRRALTSAKLKANTITTVALIGDWAKLPSVQARIARAFGRNIAQLHTAQAPALAAFGAAQATAAGTFAVWDVTPYPLGINCYYGERELFSPIVRANCAIPTPAVGDPGAYTERYCTRYPNQTSVTLDVLQYRGDRDADPQGSGRVSPTECEKLGSWEFSGLCPKPGQQAAFTVTFAVDSDGILQLFAQETETGHTLAARIERGLG